MGAWQSTFLHEFLDGNPANCRAVPGELTVLPGGLAVQPTPEPGHRGFSIKPGHSLSYAFSRPFDEVIGADIGLDLLFPPESAGEQLSGRVLLGGGVIRLLTDFVNGGARLQLFIGGDVMAMVASVPVVGPIRIRARWHTHGQAHIWVDGALRGYEPGLGAGASFVIDQLTLGHHASFFVPDVQGFLVRSLCVKLLRRDDAIKVLDQFLPIDATIPLDAACVRQIAAINDEALGIVRQFMIASLARLTSSWREGQPHAPFSPEAIAAHELALAAGRDFLEFLLHRRSTDSEQFLQRIGRFLEILAASDPAGYAQLISNLSQLSGRLEPRCRAALEPLAQQHDATLEPVADLFRAMWAKAQSP